MASKRTTKRKPRAMSAPMSHTEYCRAIASLGLSQLGAGRFLGVSPRTAQNYAAGSTEVPQAVAMLLRLMLRDGITPEAFAGQ